MNKFGVLVAVLVVAFAAAPSDAAFFGSIVDGITGAAKTVINGLKGLGNKIKNGVESAVKGGLSGLNAAIAGIEKVVDLTKVSLSSVAKLVASKSWETINNLKDHLLLNTVGKIMGLFISPAELQQSPEGQAFEAATQGLEEYLKYVTCQTSHANEDLGGMMENIVEDLQATFQKVFEKPLSLLACPVRCAGVPQTARSLQPFYELGCAPRCDEDNDSMRKCRAKEQGLLDKAKDALADYDAYLKEIQRLSEAIPNAEYLARKR